MSIKFPITGLDNTDLDHIVDGESCPHRSSGGQSIGQGQMSETYRTNEGPSEVIFLLSFINPENYQIFHFYLCSHVLQLEP